MISFFSQAVPSGRIISDTWVNQDIWSNNIISFALFVIRQIGVWAWYGNKCNAHNLVWAVSRSLLLGWGSCASIPQNNLVPKIIWTSRIIQNGVTSSRRHYGEAVLRTLYLFIISFRLTLFWMTFFHKMGKNSLPIGIQPKNKI